MSLMTDLLADLDAESAALDAMVAGLDARQWATPTPAVGWTVAHQIGHLLWTDRMAALSAARPDQFTTAIDKVLAGDDVDRYVDTAAAAEAARPQDGVMADWRATRAELAEALAAVPDGVKLPWFGPPMSAASMVSARLMETWAHGLDVADALGIERADSDRIRAVVHLAVRTRDFAYLVNGLTPPAAPFRYEITAPSGRLWTWGPDDAPDVVRGPAVDLCALATQRRNLADLQLTLIGDETVRWAGIAQCFAGPPGGGRPPAAQL